MLVKSSTVSAARGLAVSRVSNLASLSTRIRYFSEGEDWKRPPKLQRSLTKRNLLVAKAVERVKPNVDATPEETARKEEMIDIYTRTKAFMNTAPKPSRHLTELWSREKFFKSAIAGNAIAAIAVGWFQCNPVWMLPTLGYAWLGYRDSTGRKTLPYNFPFLIRFRYFMESIRDELRQYFWETNEEMNPISREIRHVIYSRSKLQGETIPFGTKHNTYGSGYEWLNHSILFPRHIDMELSSRIVIADGDDVVEPYSCNIFNISGMSYGALSHAAIKALNWGAKMGSFYHNTGEGGVSDHHCYAKADLVWNIGTGYFGCRNKETGDFDEKVFLETLKRAPQVKMLEVKLSQGAKPGHGGVLPQEKITPEIARIRGIPDTKDCLSPPWHTAFNSPQSLCDFMSKLRRLSKRPVGFKLCVGNQQEFVAIAKAIQEYPEKCCDFITVDGGEGGTGAAPLEFSNRVGTPMRDGVIFVDDVLRGANLRDDIKIICSGKISYGFSIVRALALGADVCNSARGMMYALGCIQALKCNTNKCPTGITTSDPELVNGLDVPIKSIRVKNYQVETLKMAGELAGAAGLDSLQQLNRSHIMMRVGEGKMVSYEETHPTVTKGCLLEGKGPGKLQSMWDCVKI